MSTDPCTFTDDEAARLEALHRYDILDTPPEADFDDVTRLASTICNTPVALMTLIDKDRQWFKSRFGFDWEQTDRSIAFCASTILDDHALVVENAATDSRFSHNPLVTGTTGLRFYAGVPLITPNGHRIGSLCVIDFEPRTISVEQLDALQVLARQVIASLELRRKTKVADAARDELALEIEQRNKIEDDRKRAESFMRSTLDALENFIAIIDREGKIVEVNEAWSQASLECCAPGLIANTGKGTDYIAHCESAAANGSEWAIDTAKCLRQFLTGDSATMELPEDCCQESKAARWFTVNLSAFGTGSDRHVVLSIIDISDRVSDSEKIRKLNETLEGRVERRTRDLANAYAKLQQSEKQLRSFFDNASVGVFVGSPDGTLLQVNDAYVTLTGSERPELLGQNLLDTVHPEDRDSFSKRFSQLSAGALPGFEMDIRSGGTKSARRHWRHLSMTTVQDTAGNVAQVVGLVQDMQDIKESELQRNMIFNRSLDLLLIVGPDGRIHVSNKACTRVLGYSRDELCALNYFDIIHSDDLSHARGEIERMTRGEDVDLLDIRVTTKDGDNREIIWNCVPWTESGLFLTVGRDVTRMRAAERALQEQDMMLRRAEQISNLGSWQYDYATKTVRCSDGLRAIFGHDIGLEPVALDELLTYVVADDRASLEQGVRDVIELQTPQTLRCRICRPDGTTRHVQTSMDSLRDSKGKPYAIIGACLDITDITKTVERLQRSERQLRALGRRLEKIREDERAYISREIHDQLGQMLTALKFDLTLLSGDLEEPDTAEVGATEVAESLRSMASRVDAIIDSVRVIATKLRPEGLDAFGLVPALKLHADEFEKWTQIRCTVDAPATCPAIPVDASIALFRIAQEAMTNAARHAKCSCIRISLGASDTAIQLTIADNGRGLPREKLFSTQSLGVIGMRERAAMIGAGFEISGTRNEGTVVRVTLESAIDDEGLSEQNRKFA